MKTKNASPVRQLVPAALFLALAFVLPLLTGQVPKVGNMLCPMHFPVLLCGFVRSEKKFDSLEALRDEVMKNREQVRTYFENRR